ncbi:MAG: sialate O-acetylesterase [Sphingobacteriales bacterium]|nr:MAG: sialate O-acetylesterase [Sphingobacteriales bacterium]
MKKLLVVLLILSVHVRAEVRLPSIIGDHMVLQQKSTVQLWGWAEPGEDVTVVASWDPGKSYTAKTSSGSKWQLSLATPTAGGPYTIQFKGWGAPMMVTDVLIGEVWVCSGQSNMEWSGSQQLPQSLEEAPRANNSKIRFFYVPKATSNFPQEDVRARWVVCNPEDMKKFSAIGYFFAKQINETMGYPMGMINSNWGGTPAETWTPLHVVDNDPELKAAADKLNPMDRWPVKKAQAYNAMIYPLQQFSIAGVLWYQGESNVSTHASYASLFTKMIDAWRKAWGKEFPFYFVQIAPFTYGKDNINGALLREQQTRSAVFPNTGMVITSDLVDTVTDIHPRKKKEVAARLANLALSEIYGMQDVIWKSPSYKSMSIEKEKIRISFNDVGGGLVSVNGAPNSFYIAGADGKFVTAQAKIDKDNTVLVWSKEVKEPKHVRFGFNNTDTPNLKSKEGLPVDIFRTEK